MRKQKWPRGYPSLEGTALDRADLAAQKARTKGKMKHKEFECDECGGLRLRPRVILKGHWGTTKGGILLPRMVYHFCSKDCLTKWLEKATLNEKMTL